MIKILVTGGAGFIGTYLVKELQKKDYKIIVADNLSKKESKVPIGVEFRQIDLTNKKNTDNLFKGVDICINLASMIGGIGYFHKLPGTILSTNNGILSSTFEAAVKNKIKRMIYFSSSMVFESADIYPNKEEHIAKIPSPATGYGFSKLIGEYYCKTFNKEFGLDYTIIRPFNVYGINEYPGEYIGYSHVIPDLIRKVILGQYPLEILGDGQQTRCFTHIKDLVRGVMLALGSEKAVNEDFNLGTDQETKIIELARMIWNIENSNKEFKVKHLPAFKHDVKKRIPDYSKAKNILAWEPKIKIEDGLLEVYNWLKKIEKN